MVLLRGVGMWVYIPWLLACPSTNTGGYEPVARKDAGAPLNVCAEACSSTSQCLSGFVCSTAGRCVPQTPPPSCQVDIQCHALQSGWREGCTQDNSCPTNQACIGSAADPGWCARVPTSDIPCIQTGQENVQQTRKDGSGNVTVCGLRTQRCLEGVCRVPCTQDAQCGGEYPICNTARGLCACSSTSCETNASVCQDGTCRCARNEDCTEAADRCQDGVCGCSGVGVCEPETRAHPGTRWACETAR